MPARAMKTSRPRLMPGTMFGSVVILQLGFVLMFMACVVTNVHIEAQNLNPPPVAGLVSNGHATDGAMQTAVACTANQGNSVIVAKLWKGPCLGFWPSCSKDLC